VTFSSAGRADVKVLAQISHEVFLIPQRGGQGGNDLLQSLMGSFFGGGGGGGGGTIREATQEPGGPLLARLPSRAG